MLYLIIGIGVFAVLFPNLFDFVVSILSFFWNLIGTVIMFFVGLLSHLDLGFLGDGLAFVLRTLGTLLSPILSILPDSPFIPLIPLAVLIVMYFILDDSNGRLDEGVFDFSVKLMYAWCFSAINLGMMAGASGHPLRSLSGVLESYFTPYPINLLNDAQAAAVVDLAAVERMGVFPAGDSAQMLNDVAVVRLSSDLLEDETE